MWKPPQEQNSGEKETLFEHFWKAKCVKAPRVAELTSWFRAWKTVSEVKEEEQELGVAVWA